MRREMLRVKRRTLAFVLAHTRVNAKSRPPDLHRIKNGVIPAAKKHFLQSANPKSNRWRLSVI